MIIILTPKLTMHVKNDIAMCNRIPILLQNSIHCCKNLNNIIYDTIFQRHI